MLVRFLGIPARARHQHGDATYRYCRVAFLVSAHNAPGAQGNAPGARRARRSIARARSPLPFAPLRNSYRAIVRRRDML